MSRRWSSLAVGLVAAFAAACSSRPPVSQNSPPPVVTFEAPADGAYLHGSVAISAKAVGTGKVTTFKFDAPAALATAAATMDPASRMATLTPNLDLSVFPDGPLAVSVTAKDEFGGSTSKTMTINVASKAPTISIGSPSGSTVAGAAVAVTATASAQGGASITKLELLAGPAGMGANTSAAAAFFAATWNTTLALEGSATLHFRATDSTGLVGDASIAVTVDNVRQGRLDAYVFAGAPVKDALLEVWALSNATGAVDTTAGASGLLGTGGPTDAAGRALVTLTAENYSGPVQLRAKAASGTTLQYVDPSDPGAGYIQIPSALTLTSILSSYTTGQDLPAPVTLTTTLADVELLAYAEGSHRLHPASSTIVEAAAFTDGLFTQHVQSSTPRWKLRTTVPVDLTAGPTTLTDRAYAAFTDIALNQLGKDLGTQVLVAGVINGPFLVSKLSADLSGDGQLDGKGGGGTAITTQTGSPPYAFDENTLRVRLANALDTWVQSPRNQSGLDRSTLAGAGIYATISGDTSELFGPAAPNPFDNMPPSVTTLVTYGPTLIAATSTPYSGTYVSKFAKVVVTATDPSGVKSVSVKFGAQSLDGTATTVLSTNGQTLVYTGTVDITTFSDLSYMLAVTTTDQRNNTATTTAATLTVDNTPPTVAQTQPVATTYYSATVPFDATASDGVGSGVASLTATGFTGLVDNDSAAAHVYGTWTPPFALPDGPVTGTWSTCDHVGNCATPAVSFQLDRTAPTVTVTTPQPIYIGTTTVTITATALDAGAGVQNVYAQKVSGSVVTGTKIGGYYSLPVTGLTPGANTILLWANDNASPPNGSSSGAINVTVICDTTPPTVSSAQGLLAFTSEQGLTAQTNPDGSATFPAVYKLAPGATPGLMKFSTVYRSSARVSAVPASAAEIESAVLNTKNIPAIQYRVSYVPANDAPITAISASVTVDDVVTTTTVSGVPLLQSSVDTYDLALTAASIPALATVTANATVTVVISMTDAVGQTGSDALSPFTFTWSLLAPPLVIYQDTAWADGRDSSSVYAFPASTAAYFSVWNSSAAQFVGGNVRLARYIIDNPSGVPAAVFTSATLSSLVRGASAPYDIGPTPTNGVGSQTNPGLFPSVTMPYENPWDSWGADGAYWSTGHVPGCSSSTPIDPACDPLVNSFCWMAWATNPPAQCGPGPGILPYARQVYRLAVDVTSHVVDGKTLYRNWGYWVPGAPGDEGEAVCRPNSWISSAAAQPRPGNFCPTGQVLRHVLGDTNNRVTCARPDYFTAPTAAPYDFGSIPAGVTAWRNIQSNGIDRTPAAAVGGASIVPAASAVAPGQIVLYVARPASAAAPDTLSFGGVTGTPRLEKFVSYWWQDPGFPNLRFLRWRQGVSSPTLHYCDNHVLQEKRELAAFWSMQEVLTGSIGLTTRPTTASALLGANVVLTPLTFSGTAVGSR